jgi:hypothetical protein
MMARRHSAGLVLLPVGILSGTAAQASIGDLFQAEAPLLELLAIGLAATASLVTLFWKEWFRRLQAVLARLGIHIGSRRQVRRRYSRSAYHGGASSAGLSDDIDAPARIRARVLRLRDCDAAQWDAFAQSCGASYRSAHSWLRAWASKSFLRHDLKLLELSCDGWKIGQCAVGIGRGDGVFLDKLQLAPSASAHWIEAMMAILAALGPRKYVYGWDLNLEEPRENDLRRIPGVRIEAGSPLMVHVVDFSRWATWPEYWKSTSSNTQRNARRAEKENIRVDVHQGIASLAHVPAITRLRSAMYERKGLDFGPAKVLASSVATHVTCRNYSLTAVAYDGDTPVAGFSGMEFGSQTYYIDGGSLTSNKGAAWYVQMAMLRRSWERHSDGAKFVMGYVDYATHDEDIGGGLIRSRKAVRASDFPTSIVTFSFDAQERFPVENRIEQ